MSQFTEFDRGVIAEGFSGFPIATQRLYGQRPGTVEWLLDAVERHANAEQDALDQYAQIGAASGDPVIAFVMRLILQDEQRHHRLLKRMQATLTDALNWTHSPDALPQAGAPPQMPTTELAHAVRALIDEEHSGAGYLRKLAHDQKGID